MSGEDNITQIYNSNKQLILPKSAEFVSADDITFEFDTAQQGNALIAKGHYTEEFEVPINPHNPYSGNIAEKRLYSGSVLRTDSLGYPVLGGEDYDVDNNVAYLAWNGLSWDYEVYTTWSYGHYPQPTDGFHIDSNDKYHYVIWVFHSTSEYLQHVTNASGSWVKTTIDWTNFTSEEDFSYLDSVFDKNGKLHVLYADVYGEDGRYNETSIKGMSLMHADNVTGSWRTEIVVDDIKVTGGRIVIESDNTVHLIYEKKYYYVDAGDKVHNSGYMYEVEGSYGSWSAEKVIDETESVIDNRNYDFLAAAIDSNDKIHVVRLSKSGAGDQKKCWHYEYNPGGAVTIREIFDIVEDDNFRWPTLNVLSDDTVSYIVGVEDAGDYRVEEYIFDTSWTGGQVSFRDGISDSPVFVSAVVLYDDSRAVVVLGDSPNYYVQYDILT